MSYDSQIAALSPWGYWKTDETSGNLADSSGNSRTMTVTGSPTYAQTGPDGSANAISWTNVANQHAETTATSNAGAFTYVVWVNLASAPSSNLAIMSRATAYGTVGAADGRLFIDTAGKINFSVFAGTTFTLTSTSALPTNTWVMITASIGAAGHTLRVNKADAVTPTSTNTAYTGANQFIFIRGGDSGYTGTSPIKISRAAYFTSKLTNTQTDALYDAGVPSPDAAVNAVAATATATAVAPTVSGGATVSAVAATASAAAVAPTVSGTGDATVNPPAASATAVALPPTLAWDADLSAATATATAAALAPTVSAGATISAPAAEATADAVAPFVDDGSGSQTVIVPAATATATAHAPVFTANYEVGTDTTNTFTGLDLTARGTVTITYPAPTPTVDLGTRVDAALPYPQPVMNDGRPT